MRTTCVVLEPYPRLGSQIQQKLFDVYRVFSERIFVIPYLRKLVGSSDRIIIFGGSKTIEQAFKDKFIFKSFEGYATRDEYPRYKWTKNFTRKWYGLLEQIMPAAKHWNISLGQVMEVEAILQLLSGVKYAECATNFAEVEKPHKIIVQGSCSLAERAFSLVAEKRRIPINQIYPSILSKLYDVEKFRELYKKLVLRYEEFYGKVVNLLPHEKSQKEKTNAIKVIFSTFYKNHTPTIVPVIKELYRRGVEISVVGTKEEIKKLREQLNIEKVKFIVFQRRRINKATTSISREEIENSIDELQKKLAAAEWAKYEGLPINRLFSREIFYWISTHFLEIRKSIDAAREILEEEDPDVSIHILDSRHVERACILAAQKIGISTVLVQHAIYSRTDILPFYHLTDKIAVVGDIFKEFLVERGAPADKIEVTGQPAFDGIVSGRLRPKEEIYSFLNIGAEKKLIVYATTFSIDDLSGQENWRMWEAISKSMKELRDTHLVVKLHPKDISFKIDEARLDNLSVVRDIDLYSLLNACDLLITGFSTTALEAMLLDKPVITVNLSGKPDWIPYAESGAAIEVYYGGDLLSAIKTALWDIETKKKLKAGRDPLIYKYAYKMDGKASERVSDLIIKMSEWRDKNVKV